MIRVCFVCLGNICRSPIAEGVFRNLLELEGLSTRIEAESAGIAAYHVGEAPDPRARAAGLRRGIPIQGSARQFRPKDFARFDYVLAMDRSNLDDLEIGVPDADRHKLKLLRSFDPKSPQGASVPDPYYGPETGFDQVVEICVDACRGLLAQIRRERQL